ncbi:MAG: hypothetical protein NTY08_16910 [Proteobacteria bacterium]|nr:hypothetical protein [Pseudomonadota bacterium]
MNQAKHYVFSFVFLGLVSCASTESAQLAREPLTPVPGRPLIYPTGSMEIKAPTGIEQKQEPCRPGSEIGQGRVLLPQIELGISYPVGGADDKRTQVTPYVRSGCVSSVPAM